MAKQENPPSVQQYPENKKDTTIDPHREASRKRMRELDEINRPERERGREYGD